MEKQIREILGAYEEGNLDGHFENLVDFYPKSDRSFSLYLWKQIAICR